MHFVYIKLAFTFVKNYYYSILNRILYSLKYLHYFMGLKKLLLSLQINLLNVKFSSSTVSHILLSLSKQAIYQATKQRSFSHNKKKHNQIA